MKGELIMGYTHYWRVKESPTPAQWERIKQRCKMVIEAAECELVGPLRVAGTEPIVNDLEVSFNGKEDDGCEMFSLGATMRDFDCCKTRYKPYDDVVLACLMVLKDELGVSVRISSDGEMDEFFYLRGVELYDKVFCTSVDPEKYFFVW
jgi:hypothetical protein